MKKFHFILLSRNLENNNLYAVGYFHCMLQDSSVRLQLTPGTYYAYIVKDEVEDFTNINFGVYSLNPLKLKEVANKESLGLPESDLVIKSSIEALVREHKSPLYFLENEKMMLKIVDLGA